MTIMNVRPQKNRHHALPVRQRRGSRRHRRRGSLYVVVLGVSSSVMMIGLSALMAVRVERRAAADSGDFATARLHAQSAIELGFFWMRDDPDWRSNRPNKGLWTTGQAIGTGTFSLFVDDPDDNNISSEPNNFIVMTGIGTLGDATFQLEVTLSVDGAGLTPVPGSWKQVVK